MHRSILWTAAALLVAACFWVSSPAKGGGNAPTSVNGSLVTLYRHDPVTRTLNLQTGAFGGAIMAREYHELPAHLDFGFYTEDAMTVALAEEDRGLILDLGTGDDLARTYEFEEVDGGGRAFASIRRVDNEFQIRRNFPETGFQLLKEARGILPRTGDAHRVAMPITVGNIYLVRVWNREAPETEVFAKILIVDHVPGRSLTLRWSTL
jgi:hypothetical protein